MYGQESKSAKLVKKRKTCEIASKIWLLPSIYSVFSKHFFTYFLV